MSDEYNLTPYNRAEGNEPAESDWNVSPIAYDGTREAKRVRKKLSWRIQKLQAADERRSQLAEV